MPKPVGEPGGGMANAIVGLADRDRRSARSFAIPIGIMSGVYAAEYAGTRLANAVRFAADTLNGVPSIVIGVFVYGIAVLPFRQLLGAGRRARARHHDDPADHADHRGAAAAGAVDAAGRGAGARRDARRARSSRSWCRRRCPGS